MMPAMQDFEKWLKGLSDSEYRDFRKKIGGEPQIEEGHAFTPEIRNRIYSQSMQQYLDNEIRPAFLSYAGILSDDERRTVCAENADKRATAALGISVLALLVSILVAVFK